MSTKNGPKNMLSDHFVLFLGHIVVFLFRLGEKVRKYKEVGVSL